MTLSFNKISSNKESSTMLKLAFPAIIAQLAQMSMGTIDTIMAGNLSTSALAAISVGSNLFMPLLIISMGVFMALNPLVSQANGAGRYNKLGELLRHGLYLAILATPPTVYLMFNLDTVMEMIGVQPSIIPTVSGYLKALSWGVLPLYLFLVLRFVNEGLFSTKAIMYISIAALPFNIVFNFIFMYGYFGIPAMGAVGLGYATALVWTLLFVVLFIYTAFSKKYTDFVFFKQFHQPSLRVFKEILSLGVPLAITLGMEILMFAAAGLFIGRFSIEVIAAHQIALNLASLVYMIPLGLSVAVTARVGHAVGRNSIDDIKSSTLIGLKLAVIFMIIAVLVTLSIPNQLISIYTQQPSVIEVAVQLLYMAAIFMIFDGLQVTTASALRGMKDTIVPMFLSGISYWLVGFPLGYTLAIIYELEALGFWIGIIAGLATAAILLLFRLSILFKRLT